MQNENFAFKKNRVPKIDPNRYEQKLAYGHQRVLKHLRLQRKIDDLTCLPLRIRLSEFRLSKSQRRVHKKNSGLRVSIEPMEVTEAEADLFAKHYTRLSYEPSKMGEWLPFSNEFSSTEIHKFLIFDEDKLVAASYLDILVHSTNSICGIYEPGLEKRSLGIFTILKEIEYSISIGKEFYYIGYSCEEKSMFDYKKRFHGLERYDWNGNWVPFPRLLGDL